MTLLRGGTIVDGTGAPAFVGDVLVDGDRIREVSRTSLRLGSTPHETIEAAGLVVSPGFIDSHAHSDAYLVIEPDAPSKVTQGVTTEINGQCGGSVAPRHGEARLSSDWAALLGDRLTWHSLAEYREVLAAARPAVNTVQFIGHNTLRSSVMGYAARRATEGELAKMERLLAQTLDEGGWGLTTGLIYQPGRYSTPEEVTALAKVAAARGGYYATHMRSEGDRILASIDEVLELVKATGIRAEISHLKTSGRMNWHKADEVLEKIEKAIGAGLLLGSDRYPYCAAGTDLDVLLPDWAQEGAAPAEVQRLGDANLRARIVAEIDSSDRDWSTVMVGGTWHPDNKAYSGKTVAELTGGVVASAPHPSRNGDEISPGVGCGGLGTGRPTVTPGELICSILLRDGCKTGAFFFGMSEENLAKIYSRPWVVPGSDASLRAPWGPLGADYPHPRAYATMPEFYRRVRALGFGREETVARMTSVPADRFGIRNRGRIAAGAFADIVIWNESEYRAKSTFANPHQFADGVKCVMVNGTVSYRDGRLTGNRNGRFLER